MRTRTRNGFTLLELLIVVGVIGVLTAMLLPSLNHARQSAKQARCSVNLRQLGVALQMYLDDSKGRFFSYSHDDSTGRYWYFGYETSASLSAPEGQRQVDIKKSKLYPYLSVVGGVELCPAFQYQLPSFKPKYNGASYGYGMNWVVNGQHESKWIHKASRTVAFADCAQINTFQAPASPTNPMVEEWYYVDYAWKSVHFRHNGQANVLFFDGHVEASAMWSGTLDTRLPGARIGRLNANGDSTLFQ